MAPEKLSSKQRSHLRSLAHDLDPVVHVGKEGITDPVLKSADNAFNTRELMKVKVLDGSPRDTQDTGRALAEVGLHAAQAAEDAWRQQAEAMGL